MFNRDKNGNPLSSAEDIEESDDNIVVNGQIFSKPFVEKPVNAEDHNIYIYYPSAAGGGCQILFRKIGSRSSVYSSESRIRRTGSYIYEDFMPTDGTDVKVSSKSCYQDLDWNISFAWWFLQLLCYDVGDLQARMENVYSAVLVVGCNGFTWWK